MGEPFDLDAFDKDLKETLKKGREAFEGSYSEELNDLMGLSQEEIDRITPDTTDLQVYDQLITVVKEASRVNLEQAELKNRITRLGSVAVRVAKLVPGLAGLFAV